MTNRVKLIEKKTFKHGTLFQVACHPPLPTEVWTHMKMNLRWPKEHFSELLSSSLVECLLLTPKVPGSNPDGQAYNFIGAGA
jgi:hypothetical protein